MLEVCWLFFKLGLIAFGGPAAHIALFHKEFVEKRKWMSDEHYLDLVSATSLIPGPNSTEMAIHCGYHRAGVFGLFGAGVSFILPACVMTTVLAYMYVTYSSIPMFNDFIYGIKPVVLVLILDALLKLRKKAIKKSDDYFVVAVVLALCLIGLGEVYSLLIGSFLSFGYSKIKNSLNSVDPLSIFLIFLKIGSILFGSGYVLISYLQDELVVKRSLISLEQLADAVAIGQFTPGPVLSTSSFIGYLLGGGIGAVVAAIGIFLPSFLFVWILNPYIPKMRKSPSWSLLLNSINAGVIGIMFYAVIVIGKISLTEWRGFILLGLVLALYKALPKLSSFWLVIIGSFAGKILLLF